MNKLLENLFPKYPTIKEIESCLYEENLIRDKEKLFKIHQQFRRKIDKISDDELSMLIKALPLLFRGYYVVELCTKDDRRRAEQ